MKNTLLFFFFLSICFNFNLQSQSSDSTSKDWLLLMQDPNVKFYDLQNQFNKYWENRTDYKSNGYNVFKRWEYINSSRVLNNGMLQSPEHVSNEYLMYMETFNKKNSNTKRSTSGTWSLLGPNSYFTNNTGQPTGMGRISAIAFHPSSSSTIYIGTPSGGIWKSTNSGSTWSSISGNLPMLGISSIIIDPNNADTIYVGTGDRDGGNAPGIGVYKTVNGGTTWEKISSGMGNVTVGVLLMHPNNKKILIAATSGGIYRTTNGGINWVQTLTGNFKDLKINPYNPKQLYAAKIQSVAELYRSTDNGISWARITNGVPNAGSRIVIDVAESNPSIVYIIQTSASANVFSGLLKSTDSGVSFSTMSTSPNIFDYACNGSGGSSQATYDLCLAVDPNDENTIYAGSINNWKSTDGGVNWNIVSHWVGTNFSGSSCASSVHADQHVYQWNPHNGYLYVGNDGGLYYTNNAGSSWIEITNNLGIGQFYKIGQSASNSSIVLGGLQDNGCAATNNNGSTFYTTSGGDGMETLVDYSNTTYCFNTYTNGIIRRSTSGATGSYSTIAGDGINGINESGDWVAPYSLHRSTATTMFAGYKNLWRSTNIRATPGSSIVWEKISTGETNDIIAFDQSPVNENMMYVVRNSSIKRTSNANASASSVSWTSCSLPDGFTPTDIKADYLDSNIVYASANYGVYKSINKGATWTNISSNLPSLFTNCIALDKNTPGGIYVGNQTSVWYKNNTINDWILFSTGLPPVDIRELEIYYDATPANNKIRAATYGLGVWSSDLAEISVLNPLTFNANAFNTSQIDLNWTKNLAGNNVVIAYSLTGVFGAPSPGTSYSAGNSIPGGGTVIYIGSATTFSHSSLNPNTIYYYKIWSVNGSNNYSAGLLPISATTFGYNWTAGAGTSNWFTASNWGSNRVPLSNDNVYIPASAPFQPQINANGAVCASIAIEIGASLTMSSSTQYTLTVSGNFTNNGTFNAGIGVVDFNSSENQTIDGSTSTSFYKMNVNKSITNSILEVKSVISYTAPSPNDPLLINTGTFKLSSASTITPFRNAANLGLNAKFWNNGGTVSMNNSVTINSGTIQNTSGSLSIGTAQNHNILYLNNGQLIIEGGTVTVSGPFRPNSGSSSGTFNQSGGTFIVNTLGSTSTTRGVFEINPNAVFSMSGGSIEIQRNSSNTTADFILSANSHSVSGGTLKFGNASSISSRRFRLISNKILHNLHIDGNFSHNLHILNNGITLNGDLNIGNNDTLTTNGYSFEVKGNIINNGIINSGNSLLTLTGTSSQSINGSSISKIKKLTLNNPSGLNLIGTGNLQIDSQLIITNGIITTNSNMVIISDNGIISNAGPGKFINGFCRKIGDESFVFPVGKGLVYAPISISAPSSNTDHFTASYYSNTAHPTYDTTLKLSPVTSLSEKEYWLLNRTNGSSAVSVTLSWDNTRSGTIASTNDLLVARWDGAKWVSEGNASNTGNTSVGTITSNSVSNFSPFTLANLGAVPLSIKKISLIASKKSNYTSLLSWNIISDENTDITYSLERSHDLTQWSTLYSDKTLVNSGGNNNFTFTDYRPFSGINYYRLKTIDQQQVISYSSVQFLIFDSHNPVFNLSPMPCNNELTIQTSLTEFEVTLYDMNGKIVHQSNNSKIDVSTLTNGIYNLVLIDKSGIIHSSKIIVQH